MPQRLLTLFLVVTLCAAACSGDSADRPSTTAATTTALPGTATTVPDEGPPEPTDPAPLSNPFAETITVFEIDPDSGEAVEVETVVAPASYHELLDAGIEAGAWDEVTGLELLLRHALGAVSSDEVPGALDLVTGTVTHLLGEVREAVLEGRGTAEQQERLSRLLDLAAPDTETIEMLAATATRDNVKNFRAVAGPADCAPIDPDEFSGWGEYEGCYRLYEEVVEGATVRVLYPAWFQDDPALEPVPLNAFDAAAHSYRTFGPLSTVPDVDVIFSATDTADVFDPENGSTTLASTLWTQGGAPCSVSVFAPSLGPDFGNTMAHELWHCVQREYADPFETPEWIGEGGAQYFANLAFPSLDFLGDFDSYSNDTPLFDLSYSAWVWWQFLGNREGPRAVADLHKQMTAAGDGGRAAMVGRGAQFQRFVIEYVAGRIVGPGGSTLPPAGSVSGPYRTVAKSDAGKELDFETGGFVAARFVIRYDQELRVLESNQSPGDVLVAMVKRPERGDPDAWRGVFPEVRSKCRARSYYLLAATTEVPRSTAAKVSIDEVEEAVCDPCVLGTWSLDLRTFEEMIKSQTPPLPGSDFQISGGAYYIAFDDEAVVREQRDALEITLTSQGFSLITTINSFGQGTYTADGENIGVEDLEDLFVEVIIEPFPFGGSHEPPPSAVEGGGTYECDDESLVITIPQGTISWMRVDRLLEPPVLEEG